MYCKIDAGGHSASSPTHHSVKHLNQNIVIIILTSFFRGKLLQVNLGAIPNDLVNWTSSTGPMNRVYHPLSFQLLHALRQITRQIIHDFHLQRFPRFEVYNISYESSPKLPLKGLSVLHMQVAPFKASPQSTSRHSQVRWSHWERNSHWSRISTWPVPSRRVHMCQTSNPCVHFTSIRLGTCLAYYWKVIECKTTFNSPIN